MESLENSIKQFTISATEKEVDISKAMDVYNEKTITGLGLSRFMKEMDTYIWTNIIQAIERKGLPIKDLHININTILATYNPIDHNNLARIILPICNKYREIGYTLVCKLVTNLDDDPETSRIEIKEFNYTQPPAYKAHNHGTVDTLLLVCLGTENGTGDTLL